MDAVKSLQAEGFSVYDVFTPFPIHGMDKLLGIKRSRLTIAAFCFGAMGAGLGLLMMVYMMHLDWPMDVGGKPSLLGPAYAPITFEATVLFSAFGMVFTFFAVSKMFPGKKPVLMDEKVTDDVIVIALDMNTVTDQSKAESIMLKHDAHEISQKSVHDEFFDV